MHRSCKRWLSGFVGLATLLSTLANANVEAQQPTAGGILNFVVSSKVTSYDAHRETTFGVIHPLAPFYSLLIRVDPDNPSQPAAFVCDLCTGDLAEPTDDGLTYSFTLRSGVQFHDGTPLTAGDVKASLDKIIFPPKGVPSARKAFYQMVEVVEAPTPTTVVIRLKFASSAFLPALANPFNWIYAKKDLVEGGYDWHTRHINGTGPFTFVQHQAGAFVEGRRYERYHHDGQPYLDGFKAISAPKMSVRLQAIRGDRASIEFRGFPPRARDDLVAALGSRITVQESDWNCMMGFTANQQRELFSDVRVRRALNLAVDRWGGSKYLRNIAILKSVGGIVFPGHPLAASDEELAQIAGYSRDITRSRKQARELLLDAGVKGTDFVLNNRGVDQPYKAVGTWLIDEWRKVGFRASQRVQPTPPFFATIRRTKDFDVTVDLNCQSVVNPISDVSKYLGSAGNNYGNYDDPALEELYARLIRSTDLAEQRSLMRQYERRALDEEAHFGTTLWWYRINAHRSYVKGWKTGPSHYVNQQLDSVWLDKTLM